MKSEVTIDNTQEKYEFTQELENCIRTVIDAALEYEGFGYDAEVDVTITDNDGIQEINCKYRGKDMPTDVLSFPMLEFGRDMQILNTEMDLDNNAVILGDIVISLERAAYQAEEYGHSLMRETAFLTAHSMLHLLGYDHENGGDEAAVMRRKEEDILAGLGIVRE